MTSNARLELHVPCREPIDHLMSQCNYRGRHFLCDSADFKNSVRHCVSFMNRFPAWLFHNPQERMPLRCFNENATFSAYKEYMGERLQRRRIRMEYTFVPTNKGRNKSTECIWKNQSLMNDVRAYMVQKYEYYNFCDKCLFSESDLFGQSGRMK